jgi:flagellar hook-length control protein FliK
MPAAPATVPTHAPAGAASATPAAAPTPGAGDKPAGKAASPLLADALPSDSPGDAAGGDTAGDATGDTDLQISRAPAAAASSTAVAQGLGKLGTGAEIALAAQTAGDAMRGSGTAGDAPGSAKRPAAGTAQQTLTDTPGDGKPANGVQAAATAGSATAASAVPNAPVPQASAGIPIAASSDAALNGAATDGEGSPGGTTGVGGLPGAGPHGATSASAATQPKAHAAHGAPAEQLGVHIQRAVRDGNSRITVQLNPVDLGQVDVHLDFARDGRVSATILADRPDTLDMLQRDARLLERSLQDAGLQTGSGSLSFDLRDGGRQGFGAQYQANGNSGNNVPAHADNQKTALVEQAPRALTGITDSGVDIHV